MSDNLLFRLARSDEDARILDLYEASFRRRLPEDWWQWFSYQCPTGLNRTSVVEDTSTGKLAGSYSLLPIILRLNGQKVRASLCTNVNTHPDYQGRGLFTRIGYFALAEEERYETPISLGMPNQQAYPGHMKVGWEIMCELPFLVKHECQPRQHQCHEIKRFDKRFDDFFPRIAERFNFIVMKDANFLNWRTVDRPDKQYTRFIYEEYGVLKGYIVLKHFDDKGHHKSHILDVQAENKQVLFDLMAAAETFAQGRDELNMWTNPNNPYHADFLQYGFEERESSDLLIIHFNYGDRTPAQPENWWFCLADNDVY